MQIAFKYRDVALYEDVPERRRWRMQRGLRSGSRRKTSLRRVMRQRQQEVPERR